MALRPRGALVVKDSSMTLGGSTWRGLSSSTENTVGSVGLDVQLEVTYWATLPWVAAPLTGLNLDSICKTVCVLVVVQWCVCVCVLFL